MTNHYEPILTAINQYEPWLTTIYIYLLFTSANLDDC